MEKAKNLETKLNLTNPEIYAKIDKLSDSIDSITSRLNSLDEKLNQVVVIKEMKKLK